MTGISMIRLQVSGRGFGIGTSMMSLLISTPLTLKLMLSANRIPRSLSSRGLKD